MLIHELDTGSGNIEITLYSTIVILRYYKFV